MLTRSILFALSVTTIYAEIVPWEEVWVDKEINEENLTPLLNKIKSETDTKLTALEKHVQQIVETTNSKNSAVEDMPDRLEKYLDRKFDLLMQLLLDENMSQKLIELENKIAKLETILDKPKTTSNLDQHNDMDQKELANTKCETIERDLDRKLGTIQKEIQDFGNISAQYHSHVTEKLHDLETNINQQWITLAKVVKYGENFTKLNEKYMKYFKNNMKNTFEENKRKNLKLCKERVASGFDFKQMFRLDNDTFNHVSLKNGSEGVTSFEMHFAVKAGEEATVILSPTPNPKVSDPVYEIDMEGGRGKTYTMLRVKLLDMPFKYIATPNILSRTQYKTFTIRISEGKKFEFLEDTYEGAKSIITYTHQDLRLVKYIGFASWINKHTSWFLYDCPSWS